MSIPSPSQRVVDRRLLRLGRPVRGFLAAAVIFGVAAAALTIARAVLLGRVIAGAFHAEPVADLAAPIAGLAIVAVLAAAVAWGTEVAAHHSAAGVISALRRRTVAAAFDPATADVDHGRFVVTAGPGVDTIDAYFARYVPNMVLALAVPIAVIGWMLALDPWSGVIVVVTLPLIPLFASLIGAATRPGVARRWAAFADLGTALLESLRVLPTLKAFGAGRDRRAHLADLAERHRRETMGVLRIAFLSALALELAATISVAVVAVAVGLRVLDGGLGLEPALVVLVLAPEAYLPLRRLAGDFHPAVEAVEAAGKVFDLAPEQPASPTPASHLPRGTPPEITAAGITVVHRGRAAPVLDRVDLRIAPGSWIALIGPSGSGKSTLLRVLAGLAEPATGWVEADSEAIGVDPDRWRARIGWLSQDPHLFAGTVADNVRFGRRDADNAQVSQALDDAAAGFVERLPDGMNTQVGERGVLLSAGQRSRIALARALVRLPDLLLLDEPTAHLDTLTEREVFDRLAERRGRTTIVVAAHRATAVGFADRVVRVDRGRLSEVGP